MGHILSRLLKLCKVIRFSNNKQRNGGAYGPSDLRVKARFTVTAQGCYSRNVGHESQAAAGLILHAVRLSVKLEPTTQAPHLVYVL